MKGGHYTLSMRGNVKRSLFGEMREKLSGIPWTRETVNELILWRGNYSGDHQDPLDQEKNVIHGDHSDVSVILNWFSIRLNSSKYCDIEIKHILNPKKKHVNCEKFLTFKVLNGHKKQILGQKYPKLYLEDCFEELPL